jgi:hypothetical protein
VKPLLPTLTTIGLDSAEARAGVTQDNFGTTREGASVERYTLKNKQGLVAKIITLGGISLGVVRAKAADQYTE